MKAIFKFNNGVGALLCSKCSKVIKTGNHFNGKERKAMKGEIYLEPQYCYKCKKLK